MQILTFTNQKGGTGKSSSAWAVAHCLANRGKHVVLVDADPQRNLTQSLLALDAQQSLTLTDVIEGTYTLGQAMTSVANNLWLVPAAKSLAAAEKILGTDAMYALIFRNALRDMDSHIDYVIFDTSPSPNSPLAMAAITASDLIFIPTSPEYFAYNGLENLLDLVKRIQKNLTPTLRIGGIFFTKYSPTYRRSLHHSFVNMMKEHPELGALVLQTSIRENVAVAEAQVNQQSLYQWAPGATALQDYEALTDEILTR
ncbi:ParA family protein [Hymenobacter lapidiphilus]|uniref:ParA family protein n=1 Tax=Hymenobacter lapidiphilus TaxID=2608003 RepID=A0A7Y7PQS3_9BACT|nr:ParA family protein [Hymenobacter lapidiphilus]NVO32319.1 ParA family protein [Hymenobacter lapidiphilus]